MNILFPHSVHVILILSTSSYSYIFVLIILQKLGIFGIFVTFKLIVGRTFGNGLGLRGRQAPI